RSAVVHLKGQIFGLVGEPTQALKRSLKLPNFIAQAEIDVSVLLSAVQPLQYQPLNKFPAIEQDLCLRTDATLSYGKLTDFVLKTLGQISDEHGYNYWLTPVDIYQPSMRPGDKKHKQTTWHIILSHPDKTLTTDESNKLLDKISTRAKKELKAERV
ncbi:hypothetical protein HYW36_01635, partial [Candidatus Saccharibacteria bacterium]|nr:hypothetical protein [Candidatus Saccharibacteria bacterium]